MDGFNFTEGVRQVIEAARAEADAEHVDAVSTLHLLRGVLRVAESGNDSGLTALHIDVAALHGVSGPATSPGQGSAIAVKLPLTPKAQRAVEVAMTEAQGDSHSDTGVLHLLLGMIAADGVAAQALSDAGVTKEIVRRAL